MILRRKFSPFMAMELAPIASTSGEAIEWRGLIQRFETLLWTHTMRKFRDVLTSFYGPSPLRLTIDSQKHTFRSVIDFEFALDSRADFPAVHFSRLINVDAGELNQTALDLRRTERRLLDLVERSLGKPSELDKGLANIELESFSGDHQWNQIFRELRLQDSHYNDFKRAAVNNYLKYLRAQQNVLKRLHETSVEGGSEEANPSVGETAAFDSSTISSSEELSNRFQALPHGESVEVQLDAHDQLDFMLSRYPFTLIGGKAFLLIDETGQRYPLHPGKNYVGRQSGNDVVVDAAHRAVSRRHLIVEPVGESAAVLTDLSSHGTFVPPQCVV